MENFLISITSQDLLAAPHWASGTVFTGVRRLERQANLATKCQDLETTQFIFSIFFYRLPPDPVFTTESI